jgi:hypothetical protein
VLPRYDYDVIQAGEIVGRIYRMKADREALALDDTRIAGPTDDPSGGGR